MKKRTSKEPPKPKAFQEFYGLSTGNYKSPSFDEIKKYEQLGRDLQSKAIFATIKTLIFYTKNAWYCLGVIAKRFLRLVKKDSSYRSR